MARLRPLRSDGTTGEAAWDVGSGLSLGRAADCDLVLDDEQVSRHHARLSVDGPDCILEDLGSANGVFVGEERVTRAVLAPGQAFRVGATWFVVEGDGSAGVPSAPPAPPRKPRLVAGCAIGGCLGLLAAVLVLGLAAYAWKSRSERRPTAQGVSASSPPTDASASPGSTAPAGPQVASMPPAEADVLRFTLRLATNPVLTECASMPAQWSPPLLEVPLALRVQPDGAFRFAHDWTDATGAHHLEGSGTWKDGSLTSQGRWTTRGPAGASVQEDEGTFSAGGRQILGAWFGDRIEGEFSSRLGPGTASCRERITNGLSRVDALVW
jgi:hypothetical protein